MAKSFRAQIEDFAGLTEKQMRAVVVDSVQDVLEGAQTSQPSVKVTGGTFEEGKIPVDTRSLIQSLELGYNGSYQPTQGATELSVAGFQLGYTINARWTASYAMRIELGFSGADALGRVYNQAGRFFVSKNAARWPEIVKANAAKYRVK
jgi:hypothetical protein